jgi:hypothetical protein
MPDNSGTFNQADLAQLKTQVLSGKRVKHGDKEVENYSVDEAMKLASWIGQEANQSNAVSVYNPAMDTSYF